MYWEKKITIRITVRRIVGVVLAASTIANLIIVGVVFGADSPQATPTITSVWTSSLSTATLSISTAATGEISTSMWTHTPGGVLTDTPGITQTGSLLPTHTSTPKETLVYSPVGKFCIKKFYWPRYHVQYGDTLSSLASAIVSTVSELMSANCLPSSKIYTGQILYMRRLPYTATITPSAMDIPSATATLSQTATDTPSPTATPSQTATDTPMETYTPTPTATDTPSPTETPSPTATDTPTNTYTPITPSVTPTYTLTAPPANMPAVFENSAKMTCDANVYVFFSVTVSDPEEIVSVAVLLYTKDNTLIATVPMDLRGSTYSVTHILTEPYTVYDIDHYQFRATDGLLSTSLSPVYRERENGC
jgi:LysM repeat protein